MKRHNKSNPIFQPTVGSVARRQLVYGRCWFSKMGGFVTIMTTNTIRIVPHTIANSCHHYRLTCTVYSLVAVYIVYDTRTGHCTTVQYLQILSALLTYAVSNNMNTCEYVYSRDRNTVKIISQVVVIYMHFETYYGLHIP